MEQSYVELDKYVEQVVSILRNSLANLRDSLIRSAPEQRASLIRETASQLLGDIKLYSIVIKKLKNTPNYVKYEAVLNEINQYVENVFTKGPDAVLKISDEAYKDQSLNYPILDAIQWLLSDKIHYMPSILGTYLYSCRNIYPENFDEYCRKIVFPELNDISDEDLQKLLEDVVSKMVNECKYKISYERTNNEYQYSFDCGNGIALTYQINHNFQPIFIKLDAANSEIYFDFRLSPMQKARLQEEISRTNNLEEAIALTYKLLNNVLCSAFKIPGSWKYGKEEYVYAYNMDLDIECVKLANNITLKLLPGSASNGCVLQFMVSTPLPQANTIRIFNGFEEISNIKFLGIKYNGDINFQECTADFEEGIKLKRMLLLMNVLRVYSLATQLTQYNFSVGYNQAYGWVLAISCDGLPLALIRTDEDCINMQNGFSSVDIRGYTVEKIFDTMLFMYRNLISCTIVSLLRTEQKDYLLTSRIDDILATLPHHPDISFFLADEHLHLLELNSVEPYESNICVKLQVNQSLYSKNVDFLYVRLNHQHPLESSVHLAIIKTKEIPDKNEKTAKYTLLHFPLSIGNIMTDVSNCIEEAKCFAQQLHTIISSNILSFKIMHRFMLESFQIVEITEGHVKLESPSYQSVMNGNIIKLRPTTYKSHFLSKKLVYFFNPESDEYTFYGLSYLDMFKKIIQSNKYMECIEKEYESEKFQNITISRSNACYKIKWHFPELPPLKLTINTFYNKVKAFPPIFINCYIEHALSQIANNTYSGSFLKELNHSLPYLMDLSTRPITDVGKLAIFGKSFNEIVIGYKLYKVELRFSPNSQITIKDVSSIINSESNQNCKIYKLEWLCALLQTIIDKQALGEPAPPITKVSADFEAKFDKIRAVANSSLDSSSGVIVSKAYTLQQVPYKLTGTLALRIIEYLECINIIREDKRRKDEPMENDPFTITVESDNPVLNLNFSAEKEKNVFHFEIEVNSKKIPEDEMPIMNHLKKFIQMTFHAMNLIPLVLYTGLYPALSNLLKICDQMDYTRILQRINDCIKCFQVGTQNEQHFEFSGHNYAINRKRQGQGYAYSLLYDSDDINKKITNEVIEELRNKYLTQHK